LEGSTYDWLRNHADEINDEYERILRKPIEE
jgi:hypothetical protein